MRLHIVPGSARLAVGSALLAVAASVLLSATAGQAPAAPSTVTTVAERQAAWATHQRLASSSPFAPLKWRVLGPTQQSERI